MSDLIGVAVCDECNSRIRVSEKHRSLIGKTVRCPKCHTRFTLMVESPTNNELVAVEAEEQAERRKRKRRSKDIRSRLGPNVREQAGVYAATLSAPWAVITNGDIWKMYRVTPRKGQSPRLDLVFDLALLDEDGISDTDAAHLYLLSQRGLTSGDAENEFHGVASTSPTRIYDSLLSERVLNAIRLELVERYKEECDNRVKITSEDVEDALHDLLTPLEFGT